MMVQVYRDDDGTVPTMWDNARQVEWKTVPRPWHEALVDLTQTYGSDSYRQHIYAPRKAEAGDDRVLKVVTWHDGNSETPHVLLTLPGRAFILNDAGKTVARV